MSTNRAPNTRSPARLTSRVLLVAAGLAAGLAAAPLASALSQAPVTPRPKAPTTPQDPPSATPPSAPAAGPATPETPDDDPYELRPIREIRIQQLAQDAAGRVKPGEFVPVSEGMSTLIRNQLRALEGRPFRRATVTEDIGRLNRLGRFKQISSDVSLLADGSVVVIYTVQEQAVVQDIQVVGNRELSDQELLKVVTLVQNTPVDRFQIDRSARLMEDLYRTKGYYNVKVQIDEKELADSAIVVFRVVEGQRVRVTGLTFEGNNSFTRKELLSAVKTTTYVPIFEKAPLDDEVLRQDVTSLIRFYRDRGYLDVRASYRVQPAPSGREAIVTFRVDEGPLYTLRKLEVFYSTPAAIEKYKSEILKNATASLSYLTVEQMRAIGRDPFSPSQISGLMAIKPGDVYSDDKVRKSLSSIEDAYGKLGYVLQENRFETSTVRVTVREVRDESRPEVDLILFITEGEQYQVGQIIIGRNEITKQQVILRQLDAKPDRPLDDAAIKESQQRLEDLNLFARGRVRVQIQPPDPKEPRKRDVYLEVPETNTGEFNIGAAISSDSGVIGQLSLVQRNFDIADTPDSLGEFIGGRAFRGAGQRFEATAQPGDKSQNYRLGLTEPYFLETDYSFGGSVGYSRREYDEYTESRYGGNLSLGRRFGPVWQGTVQLRNEWVSLSSIAADGPVDFFDARERRRLTGLGLVLTRTTTDNRYRPTKGSRWELGAERVGVPGDDKQFTKLKTDYTIFLNVNESFLGYKTILKLNNQIAWIPEGQSGAPTYERWSLGGRSFRGFGTRAVSPIGRRADGSLSNDPVGGAFLFFLGGEISQPIYQEIISVVGFVDSGTVDTDISLAKYRVSVGTGIRLYVPQLSPVPLAFDVAIPIKREPTDRRRLFTFSVDIPF